MVAAITVGLAGLAVSKPWWLRGVDSNDNDFLPPDVAFRVGSSVDGGILKVRWVIADGYYLYRAKFEFAAESPDLALGTASFPQGTLKTDPYLGNQEIFTRQVEATVPFTRSDFGAHPLQVKVTYQGCAEAGLCYPPISKVIFPQSAATQLQTPPHTWERAGIVGGGLAFFVAGLLLRKGRRLAMPA